MIQKFSFDLWCDHVRHDFGVKGIIIYNNGKVIIAGYPYPEFKAANDHVFTISST